MDDKEDGTLQSTPYQPRLHCRYPMKLCIYKSIISDSTENPPKIIVMIKNYIIRKQIFTNIYISTYTNVRTHPYKYLKLVWQRIFLVKNDFYWWICGWKVGKVMGHIECVVENESREKWF